MKPSLFLIFGILLSGCNHQVTTGAASSDSASEKQILKYPFTARYSLQGQPGDQKNALIVLNCLKKYVDGDIKGCVAYFADTAAFEADQFEFRGPRDSLEPIIANMRNASAAVSKNFDTWITTYFPDRNDTWVTLWYTEIMTDKKGKTDSISYVDDVLIKNGQIVEYDEKQRRFPVPPSK